jgi:hypothetical protein
MKQNVSQRMETLNNDALPLFFNSVDLVRKQTIPTERPPLVGEVAANVCE